MLLCESFSLWLLFSFTQADSVVCSEQTVAKGYFDIITILLPRTLQDPEFTYFFLIQSEEKKPFSLNPQDFCVNQIKS